MSATQFFPNSFSLAIDYALNNSTNFEDLNVDSMVYALARTWVNPQTGVNQPIYEIAYQETNAVDLTIYFYSRSSGQTIGQLSAILNSWAPANNMTQYSNLIKIDGSPISTRNVLINDSKIKRRVYKTLDGGQTDLHVSYAQELDDKRFTVSGNQTKAYTYYYNYTWAG